ncbi:MAG: hypothetical protein CL947_01490 [Epsilonproteobacteria bacterium]|nr:hypothetical protein [Campylobacterota bacterium]|tara:strand:- start:2848 stop:3048 length:201 start_codon:yes stop_codon:yes gene_type:complete
MNFEKLSGYGYMLAGLFIIIFFGGALILQLLGVLAGLLMIHHGYMMVRNQQFFRSYFNVFFNDRYR